MRRRACLRFRKLLAAALLQLLAVTAFGQDSVPSAQSAQWSLSLNGIADCTDCVSEQNFRIGVTSGADGATKEILLKSPAARLTELRLYDNLGIVRGDMPYGGDLVAVLDLASGEVLANFPAYVLQISPDNRYFIYQKWYPRFGDRNEIAALVYDLALHETERSRTFASGEDAGFRFFPEQETFEERSEAEGIGLMTGNGVLWDPGKKRAFMTMIDASGYHNLLVLKLWGAPVAAESPAVCMIPFMPRYNQSTYAPENQERDMVVESRIENDFVVVDMNDANGIQTDIRINYLYRCP